MDIFSNNTITTTLKVDFRPFAQGLKGAGDLLKGFGNSAKSILQGVGTAVRGTGGFAGLGKGGGSILQGGGTGLGNLLKGAGQGGGALLRGATGGGGLFGGGGVVGLALKMTGVMLAVHAIEKGISATVNLLKEGVVESFKLAANFERMQVAFGVMTGSESGGKALLNDLKQLATVTPYTGQQITAIAESLIGMGVAPNAVLATVSRLGDMAAGSYDKLQRLSLAYGQVMAAGRLYGTELRQFKDAGVGIEDFAKTMKVSSLEFRSLMEQGKVSANVVAETVNRLTSSGGRFADLSEKVNQTVYGRWSNMMERLALLGEKVGLKFFEKFNVAENLGSFSNWIERWQGSLESFIDTLAGIKPILTDIWEGFKIGANLIGAFSATALKGGALDGMTWENTTKQVKFFIKGLLSMLAELMDMTAAYARGLGKVMPESATKKEGWIDKLGGELGGFVMTPEAKKLLKENAGYGEAVGKTFNKDMELGKDPRQFRNMFDEAWKNMERNAKLSSITLQEQLNAAVVGGLGVPMTKELNRLKNNVLIPMQIKISPESEKAVIEFRKQMTEGLTPFDVWRRQKNELREAFHGPLEGDMKRAAAFSAKIAGGIMGAAFWEANLGLVNDQEAGMMAAMNFLDLEKGLGLSEMKLPDAMAFGSASAANTIAQATAAQTDVQQRVLQVLEQAKMQAEERKKVLDEIARALDKIGELPGRINLNAKRR